MRDGCAGSGGKPEAKEEEEGGGPTAVKVVVDHGASTLATVRALAPMLAGTRVRRLELASPTEGGSLAGLTKLLPPNVTHLKVIDAHTSCALSNDER